MKKLTKREKILLGVSIVGAGVAGFIIYKQHNIIIEALFDKIERHKIITNLNNDNQVLKCDVQTLMEAASEGVFEEAIGTVNNKINYRTDKKKYLLESLETNPNNDEIKQALDKVNVELKNLFTRKDKYIKAQTLYEIKDEI